MYTPEPEHDRLVYFADASADERAAGAATDAAAARRAHVDLALQPDGAMHNASRVQTWGVAKTNYP